MGETQELPSWLTPIEDTTTEPTEELPSWLTPVEDSEPVIDESLPSWLTPVGPKPSSSDASSEAYEYKLPEAGSYSQSELSSDDDLYRPILDFMELRYGLQAVENKDKSEIVDMFLNNRRGNAFGNSISAVGEADFLYGIKDDQKKLAVVGRAYNVYENMATIFNSETTWAETGGVISDAVWYALADPVNLLGGFIGKAVGGTATRAGVKTLNKVATEAMLKELGKGAVTKTTQKAANKAYRAAANVAKKKASVELSNTAAKLAATKGFNRVITKAGLKEVGAATLVESIATTGTEWLYQRSLVDTGVQEETNPYALGLAALSALTMGGLQAGRVAYRGSSNTALVSEVVKSGTPADVAKQLEESINNYYKEGAPSSSSWSEKVKGGVELEAKDTEFFIELLLGRTAKESSEAKGPVKPKLIEARGPEGYIEGHAKRALDTRLKAQENTYESNVGSSKVTGYFKKPVALDPKALKDIKGAMGEEAFRDSGSKLKRLEESIAKEGYKPDPILIHVRDDGVPFVVEGNHRLAEAVKSGRESIDVEVSYVAGGQDAKGILNPDNLPLAGKSTKAVEEGEVLFKGLSSILLENGLFYSKRTDLEDDNISNWVADFIKEMDDDSVRGIIKAYNKGSEAPIKGLSEITSEEFSRIFAKKMNQGGKTLNALRQVAGQVGVDLKDLNIESFLEAAMGLKLLETPPTRFEKWGGSVGSNIAKLQNNMIKSLVSHPSTSWLNVVGWGASSGLGSANDMVNALFYASRGTLEKLTSMGDSSNSFHIAQSLVKANAQRVRFLVDSDMTKEAFISALLKNTGAMETLSKVQSGGVQISSGIKELSKMSPANRKFWQKFEGAVDVIQAVTFVDAQDLFTKSQEYMFQMDKALRVTFKKGYSEFYNDPGAVQAMATKAYRLIEAAAVNKTMEHTFAKSYKGSGPLGEVAGVIEDVRNIPLLGALIPFGRFFNNTIDFMIKNSPLSLAAKLGGLYEDVPVQELVIRSAVALGLVYTFSKEEDEKRRQGLGLYEVVDNSTGAVRSLQYDYPLSLFQAAGRVMSYKQAGEEVPDEIAEQIIRDFFGGSLTRNLSKSGDVMIDAVSSLVKMELEEAGASASKSLGSVTSQYISASTRFLEPINELIGLAAPDSVERRKELNVDIGIKKQLKDSLRYINNIADLFTGKASSILKQSSAEGSKRPQATKQMGVRLSSHTDTLRVMHMMGYEGWTLNASAAVNNITPLAGNKYQKIFHSFIEVEASKLLDNKEFRNATTDTQRGMWEDAVERVRAVSQNALTLGEKPEENLSLQFDITNKYSADSIQEGLEDLEIEGDVYELNSNTLIILEGYLRNKDTLEELSRSPGLYR